ncbi:PAS domain S-box protein [Halobacteria archaeon AArc-m2/3/4]|uniref:histidine kinase n=1 Tax=Natronoglomus mannanivorans TaxID=2979990 RepID=A0ABT2Q892_9EURY|nr:PAS domain S-box protein [Halobacteria archaeon AArc-m2/3/4]
MGSPDSTPDETLQEIRTLFTHLDKPSQPVTAATVAEKLECTRQTAHQSLQELADRGDLQTSELHGGTRVWWRPENEIEDHVSDEQPEQTEFQAFVNAVTDYAIFMLNPDGTVASWNKGVERIKGYQESEIVGKHFSTFYTDDDIEEGVPEENLEAAAAEGRTTDEGWRVRNDGSRFWAYVTITAIHDDDGTLQGFTKVTRDMTERREFEQQLRKERDLTEQILETVPVSIGVFDSDGHLVRANSRMLARHGLDASDLPEYSLTSVDVYDAEGDPIPTAEQPWMQVLETGESVHGFQCQVELPNSSRQWLSINAAPLEIESANSDRVVAAVEDISEQKERERQLEQQKTELETQLSEILGRISDAFYALDDEWRFTHLNDQAAEIMGQSREELLDQEVWDVFPDAVDTYKEHFQRAMDTQEPVTFEVFAEGREVWLEFNVYPSESGLSIYFRDVTDRKERERTLAKYETIVETVKDGIYVKDEDGYFTMVNDAYADLTGYEKDELVGAHASLVVDEDTIEQAKERKAAMADDGASDPTLEAVVQTVDDENVPAEATFATIETHSGETEQVGVVRDISDRLEYQRKIEESERRYRTLAENFPNGAVALFNEDLEYTAVGGQLLEVEGVDPEDRVGQSLFELYPEDLIHEIEPYFHAALNGDEDSFELDFAGYHLLNHILPVTNADNEIDTGMLVVQDVTERKEYERQLEESNERLEQFAYAASHDLQEPLRMVTSYLQLLDQRYTDDLDEDAREFIEFAVDGAERMREMIEGLLEYSRVDTQGDPFESVDLEMVLSDVQDDLQLQIEESNAEITAESLPRVEGDPGQLRQVFQNLLDNAIEYSGDEPPQVHVAVERDGAMWEVSVHDEGIGIDPDEADRIFDVFQRLHSQEEHSGTGIGLALCRRIIERHDGKIWVESSPGEGATFSFTVPAVSEIDGDTEE